MKPVSFSTFKKLQKLSLNEFNKWCRIVYESGVQDGINVSEADVVAEIGEEDLKKAILSVKGIGEVRADQIIKAIMTEGNK